jgi:hypothetical protein
VGEWRVNLELEMDFNQLVQQLRLWNGRRRLLDGLLWLPRGLLAGLLLAVLVAVVARFRPFLTNEEVAYVAVGTAVIGLVIAIIWLLLRRFSLIEQARFADSEFALQERSSTAVEIHDQQIEATSTMASLQLSDTLEAARLVDTKVQLPFVLNRQDWPVILAAVALLVMAVLLPNPQESIVKENRAVKESIEEQIEAIEALQEEILENPALTEAQREELLEPLEGALQELGVGDLSREEAVAVLSEAEADLRELEANNSTNSLQQALQDAGQPLADNEASQSLGQALQNGNLAQAGAAAAQLADDLPQMSQEELAQLAQDLAQTAESLANIDTELAQELAQAAQALQNGDVAAAQQALQQASGTLQQRAQEGAAAAQADQAAGQLNQGRQEVAQAGQPGQGQQGQGQQAQGQGQGQQGQGQGQNGQQGQGQGQGEGQGGEGSGNGDGSGSGSQNNTGEGTGGPGPGGGHAENVFVPDFVDLSGETGVDIELPAECLANPADCGGLLSENPTDFTTEGSTIPYDQVFGDYRDAANEALQDDYIPLGLKGYIRDYFSSLEP